MKAIVYDHYGGPDALQVKDVVLQRPKEGEVLINIKATSLNSWDWDLLRGKPFYVRLVGGGGLFKPKHPILGSDVAGVVEAVGANVSKFKLGDKVFGDIAVNGWGGLAEYVCAPEKLLTHMSPQMSFEDAAAIPQAGLLALQGLRDKKRIEPGQRVLINGAGGGVGTFAIQMAKQMGAEITAVDHGAKLDFLRTLGADRVVDYAQQDYTRAGDRYDFILDGVAHRSIFDYKRALSPHGIYVMVGGSMSALLQVAALGKLATRKSDQRIEILAWRPSAEDLDHMKTLYEAGDVRPIVDRCFSLAEAGEALQYLGEGRAKGKVVLTI